MQVVKGKQYVCLLLKALILPFFFILISYVLIFIFSTIYTYQKYNQLKLEHPNYQVEQIDKLYNETLSNIEFQNDLANYLDKQSLLIVLITVIIFIPIFIKKCPKQQQKLKKLDILKLIGIGITLAIFLNLIIIFLNELLNLNNTNNNKIMWKLLLTTGIIGPILEEFLFRGILYNKLKEFNKKRAAMILTSIIFALIHFNLSQIIYAFLFSLVLIKIYEHFKTLKAPIIVHISANTFIALTINYLINFNLIINIVILLISLIGYIMLSKTIKTNQISLH